MRRHKHFECLSPQSILDIMDSMLSVERCRYFGRIREDDYEWVIGVDVWDKIAHNGSRFFTSLIYKEHEPIYKIFDIEVTISKNELNTITLRKKNEKEKRNAETYIC